MKNGKETKMKNIFKTSKRSIAAILTLCILLGIAGTCVYAASAVPEENSTVTDETTQELVPVMASECCHTYTNRSYSGGTCITCHKSVKGTAIVCSKCGSGWVELTCGHRFSTNN